jgi:hypothetical protein
MSTPTFTLRVPSDEPFRGLVSDAVRAYLKACGHGASPAAESFATSIAGAVQRLAGRGADIDVAVLSGESAIAVQVTCGGASETLTHPVTAGG